MGYPMTWKRLIGRNRLQDGDYDKLDRACPLYVSEWKSADPGHLINTHNEQASSVNRALQSFLGDLRRLERDAVDEGAIALHIAARTGIDQDTVAAVLKEFMNW